MIGFITVIHVILCILLVIIILMQAGRGGGLTEGFQAAEQVFGAKTNTVLVKASAVLATAFLITSLSLAFFSSQKDRSLMAEKMAEKMADAQTAASTQEQSQQAQPVQPVVEKMSDTVTEAVANAVVQP